MQNKRVVIIGSGPAGLTAAYELLKCDETYDIVVVEREAILGGLSRTHDYKGNKIDIGGHRFFSKSDKITNWWLSILPLQGEQTPDDRLLGRTMQMSCLPDAPNPETDEQVMLTRKRNSHIYFHGKLIEYPVALNFNMLQLLGPKQLLHICLDYLRAKMFPVRPEATLEDFFINRFGRELYSIFFKHYTEKVWGVPCTSISPEWGAQRVKGVSPTKVLLHALRTLFYQDHSIGQKNAETSLIGRFLYPKRGPGQLWESVGRAVVSQGGTILRRSEVVRLVHENLRVVAIDIRSLDTGEVSRIAADYVISSAPIKDLAMMFDPPLPDHLRAISNGLVYRDFMTIGMLVSRLGIRHDDPHTAGVNGIPPDNWIYIQDPSVKLGRLQIFNNWSPYMMVDPNTIWLGLEYFCTEGDALWSRSDAEIIAFAQEELERLGIVTRQDMLDAVVLRVPKAYPAYFGTYDRLSEVRTHLDKFENLFLVGRNGMHRYNNMDHSMLSAMEAVRNITERRTDKDNIWSVNTEQDYHEAKEE